MSKQGFLYVATGSRFKSEAIVSVRSLKAHMPNAMATVFCDSPDGGLESEFDELHVIRDPTFSFYDKIYAFLNCPYERGIFIDTDTFVCAPLDDLFEILERFDIAAVRDHWSGNKTDCPGCFDDFNTGLVCFNRKPEVISAFKDWERIYREQIETGANVEHDQPSFRSAIYAASSIAVYVLPKNYNIRLTSPIFLGIDYSPKILHGRSIDYLRLVSLFSSSRDFRFFLPNGSLADRTEMRVIDERSGIIMNFCFRIGRAITRFIRKML